MQQSPLCMRVWAWLPTHSRSLQSFWVTNGFPCSEHTNEPAWEVTGTERPQAEVVKGVSTSY